MTRAPVPFRRIARPLAALAIPTIAVLIAAVAFSELNPWAAVLYALIVVGCLYLVLRVYLADVSAFTAYAGAIARGDADPPPQLSRGGALTELTGAIDRLQRTFTDRRTALAALAQESETVLDSLLDPLLVLDRTRRVTSANAAARALFGPRITGDDLSTVVRNPAVLQAADAVLAGATGQAVEFAVRTPAERMFSVRIAGLAASGAGGARAVLAFYDVTALKQIERTRSDFVANASHELRTPLSVLLGCIQTLAGPARADRAAQDKFFPLMQEQVERMSRLVSDLLSLSRIELDEHRAPHGRADMTEIARVVADALTVKARARNMTIEIAAPDGLPQAIGDERELEQVLQNLIDNAIKYGRDGSCVRVTARRVGAERPATVAADEVIALAVADEGEGIAPEHLPRLTERFYRVDTARSRALGGTGLGLAIVKHIVNHHRGHLAIESKQGKGSTFTVFLPAASAGNDAANA